MSEDTKLIPYKEIIKKKSLGYYYTTREDAICKKNQRKTQYVNSRTKKKDRQEYKKRWYESLSPERKQEIKQKKSEYSKNRYDNGMVPIRK